MTAHFPVMYVPMPLNANGDGPADAADTVSVAHEVWDAETNVTICTAKDEATANLIVAAWNLRTQAPDSWRPIETAPKDGDAILITRPTLFTAEERWHVVRWDEGDEMWVCHDGKFDSYLRGPDPTHWMPLPSAPALRPQTAESA